MADDGSKRSYESDFYGTLGLRLVVAAALLFLCLLAWQLVWGFAGPETHFCGGFYFVQTDSREELIVCPLERRAAGLAVLFLVMGAVMGVSILNRRFGLRRLLAAVVLAAAMGAFPFLALQFMPPRTDASLEINFENDLSLSLVEDMKNRLAPSSVAKWEPGDEGSMVRAPSEDELAQAGYNVEVNKRGARVLFMFTGISFARRNEIREFYTAFLESELATVAKEAGFAPVLPENREVRYELQEK